MMEEAAEEKGVELKQIHYLYKIRFVESEYRCFTNFLFDYAVIVDYLKKYLLEEGEDETTKAKVRGWLRKITELKFVAVMLISVDTHFESKIFSKTTQSDAETGRHTGLDMNVQG